MRDYRKLLVWQKSHELVLTVYKSSKNFPKDEQYGLISQLRRSSISVPSNIAEGCGRTSQSQFAHCLNIAMGSASELEYQIILSKELGYINNQNFKELLFKVKEVKQMLTSLYNKVKAEG